ncbi:hypothetical protein ACLOJK_011791 [Asimina triloba]
MDPSVALFSAWARQQTSAMRYKSDIRNAMVLGSIAGSVLLRKAASLAFMDKKRATLPTDIIEHLGKRTCALPSDTRSLEDWSHRRSNYFTNCTAFPLYDADFGTQPDGGILFMGLDHAMELKLG